MNFINLPTFPSLTNSAVTTQSILPGPGSDLRGHRPRLGRHPAGQNVRGPEVGGDVDRGEGDVQDALQAPGLPRILQADADHQAEEAVFQRGGEEVAEVFRERRHRVHKERRRFVEDFEFV